MPTLPIVNMELQFLEMRETYEDSGCGFQFAGTLVVYQVQGLLYHAKLKGRCSSPSIVNAEDLMNVKQIPASAYDPKFPVGFTLSPGSLPNGCHVKKPRLINCDRISEGPQPSLIAEDILREARIYELLTLHPHPNIATYLGCQVSDGTITGLCLKKYPHTLMKEVNPGALKKRALRNMRKAKGEYSHFLTGIENGIQHLHSLGLVHNDINPSNIMIDEDRAIIIDFGSCRKLGESLENVGRTYEWCDDKVRSLF